MAFPLPRLDDRSFDQLVEQAIARARATCPDWTDFSPGDPGVTLIEAFAFLTEAMLYRLNRVPPKLRLALLNLAGVTMRPPSAASVELAFSRIAGSPQDAKITIPAGTTVTSADGSVQFMVTARAVIEAGQTSAAAPALHCELVVDELLGTTSGAAGQRFTVARPAVIAPTADRLDFVLGVEFSDHAVRQAGDKKFEIWREVAVFSDSSSDDPVYQLDRASGRIQFGSDSGAGRIPPVGLLVRASYRCGGGRAGNVAAGSLTTIRGGPAGIEVTNPERAANGGDLETVTELERRAPSAISTRGVAVTAHDYEQVVLEAAGFARALAYAQAQIWRHAAPGVVEVAAMPWIDASAQPDGAITVAVVNAHRTDDLLRIGQAEIDQRRPLGVRAVVSWAKVRPVSVALRVVIGLEADPLAVEHGVKRRINALFSPMRDLPFGQQLRASEVYERILNEPGVRYADQFTFAISDSPERDVIDLVHDPIQPMTWFAVSKTDLHRTLDDGDSWASVYRPADGEPRFIRRHPGRPGLAVLAVARGAKSYVVLTSDLGESWGAPLVSFDFEIFDAAWIERDGHALLLLATAEGLRQIVPDVDTGASAVVVDKVLDTKGFYSVAAIVSPSGVVSVAVAARADNGVFLSPSGGVSGTFKKVGLDNKDVRSLVVQSTGGRNYLWASIGAQAGEQGEGAQRLELRADGAQDPAGFTRFNIGWQGGSCEGIAFADGLVVAGANRGGVLTLDTTAAAPAWVQAKPDSRLPIRDTERFFEVVGTVAAAPAAADALNPAPTILAGGVRGVYRSTDLGKSYLPVSASKFTDYVPLPARWLYCTAEHSVTIVQDGR